MADKFKSGDYDDTELDNYRDEKLLDEVNINP